MPASRQLGPTGRSSRGPSGGLYRTTARIGASPIATTRWRSFGGIRTTVPGPQVTGRSSPRVDLALALQHVHDLVLGLVQVRFGLAARLHGAEVHLEPAAERTVPPAGRSRCPGGRAGRRRRYCSINEPCRFSAMIAPAGGERSGPPCPSRPAVSGGIAEGVGVARVQDHGDRASAPAKVVSGTWSIEVSKGVDDEGSARGLWSRTGMRDGHGAWISSRRRPRM